VSKKVKKGRLKKVPCKIKKNKIKKELVEKQTRKTEAVARQHILDQVTESDNHFEKVLKSEILPVFLTAKGLSRDLLSR
jgi:hypothetical protein